MTPSDGTHTSPLIVDHNRHPLELDAGRTGTITGFRVTLDGAVPADHDLSPEPAPGRIT